MLRMREPTNTVVRFGIVAVLIAILCTPLVPSASAQDAPEIQPPAPQAVLQTTPWGTPVLVSPRAGTALNHYPRTTTLAWQPVFSATSYVVERQFLSGTTWSSYPTVTVTGNGNASYTFDFVGDQRGRWRVTAYNGVTYSSPSTWWTFSYLTVPQMPTPVQTNPANNEIFGHYPRYITLSWKQVPAASGYTVEIAFCNADRVTCSNYTPVTITDPLKSDYTFSFVGAQPGKWRVTALASSGYRNGSPSGWRWFSFTQ